MSISCGNVHGDKNIYNLIVGDVLVISDENSLINKETKCDFLEDKYHKTDKYRYLTSKIDNLYTVSYSRISGLTDNQIVLLVNYYDNKLVIENNKNQFMVDVRKRITQHYYDTDVYIQEARRMRRRLTEHEQAFLCDGILHKKISVSHIIANVTIQCMFNHLTLQFISGKETISQHMHNLICAQKNLRQSEIRLKKSIDENLENNNGEQKEEDYKLTCDVNNRKASFKYHSDKLNKTYAPIIAALASQVAAVARMRGIGRAIIHEESGEAGYGEIIQLVQTESQNIFNKRNKMAKDISVAFGETGLSNFKTFSAKSQGRGRSKSEGDAIHNHKYSSFTETRARANSFSTCEASEKQNRLIAYINYMRHITDSVGNLRLGDSSGNAQVGAGFDMPLTKDNNPTNRGQRLLHALQTYGLSHFIEPGKYGCGDATYKTGIFSVDSSGSRIASSREAISDA